MLGFRTKTPTVLLPRAHAHPRPLGSAWPRPQAQADGQPLWDPAVPEAGEEQDTPSHTAFKCRPERTHGFPPIAARTNHRPPVTATAPGSTAPPCAGHQEQSGRRTHGQPQAAASPTGRPTSGGSNTEQLSPHPPGERDQNASGLKLQRPGGVHIAAAQQPSPPNCMQLGSGTSA